MGIFCERLHISSHGLNPVMNKSPDILVVGGGLIGMLTAFEFSREGLHVCLLERGETGQESSWAGGGILSPLYPWRYDDAVSQLATWSQQAYPDLLATLHEMSGIDPEWQHSGLLILDVDDPEKAQDWATRFTQQLEWLDPAELAGQRPGLGVRPGQPSAWLPTVGQIRNPRFVRALRKAIELAGVDIHTGTEVTGFKTSPVGVEGVVTATGQTFLADKVVVAGGAWSSELLAKTGVSIEVEPVRGQMLLYRAEPGVLNNILLYQSRYVIPRKDGRILIGSTLEHVGFDKGITGNAREDLQSAALELLPALADYPVEHHWAGLRPGSPAGIPYIGRHPDIAGLYMNCGHFRNGVILAPASVRLLVDSVLGNEPIINPLEYMVNSQASRLA